MTQFLPDDLGGARDPVVLDPDELTVGSAYARLMPIIDWLIDKPFDRAGYAAMASYLDGEGQRAADAFERLVTRGEMSLARRASQIEAGLGRSETP